uniref:Ig-like domain-containing protein n=1 Tax=Sinocyclocheilus anshuiensis TaxID=1608454 RepID=A0A671SC14_9TELE
IHTPMQCRYLICLSTVFIPVGQTSAHIVLQSTRFMSALPGDDVTLDCSMAAGVSMSSYTMYWYKQDHYGQPIQFIIKEYDKPTQNYEAILNTMDSRFSLNISKLTPQDSGTYYCAASSQAIFGEGTRLTVLEHDIRKPEVEILKPSGTETSCKQKVTLVCVAKNFYPDHVSITWTVGSKEIKDDVATDPYATQDKETKLFSITSRLKVSKKEFKPQNTFRCTVRFYNETDVSINRHGEINGIAGISLDTS